MFTLALEIARTVLDRSGAEAALSAFDRSPAPSTAPVVDTADQPYVTSAEAGLSVA